MDTVVIKLGGSLLDADGLGERLTQLIERLDQSRVLIVVGGGGGADLVRACDAFEDMPEEEAHWLAIGAMTFNEQFIERSLPNSVIVADLLEAEGAWAEGKTAIAHAEAFLRNAEELGDGLPHTWDVTSDSIAAWLARQFQAPRLIMTKAVDLADDPAIDAAVESERVDRYFPHLMSPSLAVDWVNLNEATPAIHAWISH